jgi:DNA gyrase/topoisomerase IV subunit A
MSDTPIPPTNGDAGDAADDPSLSVQPVALQDEMERSFLDYAMSVIISRALPDARDGLKPVHRRALYAMYDLNNDWNRPYKKSARIVGDVIGKYHPHGDQSVYDTIVRLAQDFPVRIRFTESVPPDLLRVGATATATIFTRPRDETR